MSRRDVACCVWPFPNRNMGLSCRTTWYVGISYESNIRAILVTPQTDSVAPVSMMAFRAFIAKVALSVAGTSHWRTSPNDELWHAQRPIAIRTCAAAPQRSWRPKEKQPKSLVDRALAHSPHIHLSSNGDLGLRATAAGDSKAPTETLHARRSFDQISEFLPIDGQNDIISDVSKFRNLMTLSLKKRFPLIQTPSIP